MDSTATKAALGANLGDLVALRRDLHAHPELGFEETRTAGIVAATLRALGVETIEGVGRLGVVGTIRGRRPGQGAIGLRADMDALALTETTGLPHASQNTGRMHACGHDGHTTMLLGAARMLVENPDFAGTVHLIFQPAEEGRGGAKAMLADRLFERFPCDAVYGLHNMPNLPLGQFAIRKGPLMAGSGRWTTIFRGTGGHGGNSPHLATDVTISMAMYIQALQTIVSRSVSAMETAVVSVGHIAAGTAQALNVMPSELVIGGTMRSFTPKVQELVDRRIQELAHACAAAHGTTAEVSLFWNAAPTINHDRETDIATTAARAIAGASLVDADTTPVTGGEDFSFMLQEKAGSFIFLGTGTEHALHTPMYDFNDAAIPHGVAYWVSLVRQELG